MPRRPRVAMGGYVYHVINRGVGRMTLFEDAEDYAAFERVLLRTLERQPMRLLAYCLMPNHWHLLLWPTGDDDLSRFMRLLTVTHAQRWHAHRQSSGTGPIYQGRYKSFPVETDQAYLAVARYVERNALRANLVERAEQWPWCSLHVRSGRRSEMATALSAWPVDQPRNWTWRVNQPQTQAELERIHRSLSRGAPLGSDEWVHKTAAKLNLESTLRPRGRPKRRTENKQ